MTQFKVAGNATVRLATVFSGIGAIEHAFERMKIPTRIVFACDIDPFVKESYFANYPISEDRWFNDIHDLDAKKYRNQVDLLVGGSPCQSFSMVGKRQGLEDPRGLLIYQFVRIVNEVQPKVFIFENVKGLTNHNQGKTWQDLLRRFRETGYDFHYAVLNGKDFGIPQNRERIFVIGFKKARPDFTFPEPIPLKIHMQDLLEDAADPKYALPKKGIAFVTKQKNILKKYTQINGEIALCQKANQQFNWHGDFVLECFGPIPEKYFLSKKVATYVTASGTKKFYSRPQLDLQIARPLLSTMHKMHRAGVDNYVTRNGRIRKLTPRECLRLMGFDDRFRIRVSDTQAYRQAGNSVIVNVLIHLLRQIDIEKYAESRHASRASDHAQRIAIPIITYT